MNRITVFILCSSLGVSATLAQPCTPNQLPPVIRAAIAGQYPEWQIVTRNMLPSDDQKIVDTEKLCPSFISGRFTSEHLEYVVNMARELDGKNLEQIILFNGDASRKITIVPPARSDRWGVLSMTKPGKYKEWDSEKRVYTQRHGILFSYLESSDELFYWNGMKFSSLLLSN